MCPKHGGGRHAGFLRNGFTIEWCAECGDRFCRKHIASYEGRWLCRGDAKRLGLLAGGKK